jgi:hypothetical protein
MYSIFHHQPFSYIDHILKPEISELKLFVVEHYVMLCSLIDTRVSEVYAAPVVMVETGCEGQAPDDSQILPLIISSYVGGRRFLRNCVMA